MSQFDEVRQAKALHKSAILSRPNVVGVGVGYKVSGKQVSDELSVVVLVRRKIPDAGLSAEALVPQEISGVRTDVIEVGDLRPLQANTQRWRPAPAGVSLGHYQITAGTLGYVVRDRASGARLILSNNHVLANGNAASPGDPILQPGPADGGQMDKDVIARLERFSPIQFGVNTEEPVCNLAKGYARVGNVLASLLGSSHRVQALRVNPQAVNLADAAVARPIDDLSVLDQVMEIGTVTGVVSAALGMSVRKSGRTTALTTGEITVMDATVTVNYGLTAEKSATFENQMVTSPMSRGGDSGALLVAGGSQQAVGLLFAGSDLATIFNPIQAVLDCLKVDIVGPAGGAKDGRQALIEKAQAVRRAYQDQLMAKANVVGVGVGLRHTGHKRSDAVALVVMVRQKLPKALLAPEDVLPSEIEGVPVDVKEVGEVKSLPSE
jgi:hypothetical protein